MLILEPGGSELAVSEGFIWLNSGKTTFQIWTPAHCASTRAGR